MLSFVVKRLWYGFLVMLGVVSLLFVIFYKLPSPAQMMAGQRTDVSTIEAINKDIGRDQPFVVQYLNYLNDLSPVSFHRIDDTDHFFYLNPLKYGEPFRLIEGEKWSTVLKAPYLRRSYQSGRKVSELLGDAFPKTALLAVSSILIAIVLGIIFGIISALNRDTIIDRLLMIVSVFGMSLPSFFAAIIIAWVFAFLLADITGLNMVGSMYEVDDLGRGEFLNLRNLILPAITLGIRPLAIVTELTKSSLLDVLSQDYIRTAKAKGLSRIRVIFGHAMRNALNPVVTAVSGWFASLLAGAVFVEYVFDWKGVGVVIVGGLEKYDFPVVMGAVLIIAIILVIINILTDILYGFLDPRIRLSN